MTRLIIAAVLGLAAALPAAAQFQRPEQAVRYRQAAMSLQNTHLSRLYAMVNGRVPFDAKTANDNIEVVALMNRLPFVAFIEGTDKLPGTKARPEVWTEKDKFAAAVTKSQDEVVKLVAAGKTGNLEQIKTATMAVVQTCDGCHDNFRAK